MQGFLRSCAVKRPSSAEIRKQSAGRRGGKAASTALSRAVSPCGAAFGNGGVRSSLQVSSPRSEASGRERLVALGVVES